MAKLQSLEVVGDFTLNDKTNILEMIYPIGSIYMSINNVNPKDLFGFGEWERWCSGRVPVGVWEYDTDFDAPDKYGGEKTHNHGKGDMVALIGSANSDQYTLGFKHDQAYVGQTATYVVRGASVSSGGTIVHNTAIAGSTSASSSMPPYQVCYMWKRIA